MCVYWLLLVSTGFWFGKIGKGQKIDYMRVSKFLYIYREQSSYKAYNYMIIAIQIVRQNTAHDTHTPKVITIRPQADYRFNKE